MYRTMHCTMQKQFTSSHRCKEKFYTYSLHDLLHLVQSVDLLVQGRGLDDDLLKTLGSDSNLEVTKKAI